jgi:ribonuclease P protein component
VLPRAARLTRRQDFALAVRRGRRAARGTLVVHLFEATDRTAPAAGAARPARVGFVVGRAVGGSVDRHRVVRRLRHLARERLDVIPPGSLVVVRALPPARDADSGTLAKDLDAALHRLAPARRAVAAAVDRPADPGTQPVLK